MPIVLNCLRCGEPLPPLTEDEEKLVRAGKPFTAVHEVCPADRPAAEAERRARTRRFEARVRIVEVREQVAESQPVGLWVPGGSGQASAPTVQVPRDPEVIELAGFTAVAEGPNLVDTIRPLALALGEEWMKVEQNASLVDIPDIADLEQPANEVTTLPRDGESVEDTIARHVEAQYGPSRCEHGVDRALVYCPPCGPVQS